MILVDWITFQTRYLPKKEIYVIEEDDRWTLYTCHELYKIACVVEKNSDQAENMMFIERYFAGKPNVIKVFSVGEDDVKIEEEEFDVPVDEEMMINEELEEDNGI